MVTKKAISLNYNVFSQNYRIDALRLAKEVCYNLDIQILDFDEIKICGILYKGAYSTTIGLNSRRSATGKNFDCMHELIHYWFHEFDMFYCVDDILNHIEWQANEGAAQFLVPYQSFIPVYCHFFDKFYGRYSPSGAHKALISALSQNYMVGESVIEIRIKSLKQEIAQYLDRIPVEQIKIKTRNSDT